MKPWMIVATIVSLAAGRSLPLPQDSLLFYYTFNDSSVVDTLVKDFSGNGHNLIATKKPTLVADRLGNPQSAVSMDGTWYIAGGIDTALLNKMTAGDFTFGLMFQTTATSGTMTARMDIAGMGDPYNSGLYLSFNNNDIRIFLGNHGYYDSPTALNDGAWHFVAATRQSGNVTLYVDGAVATAGGAYTASLAPIEGTFVIGKHGIRKESYYTGLLDDIFFYNRALSATEILDANETFSGFGVTMIQASDTFTVAKPAFLWHAVPKTIAYAIEVDTSTQFTNPLVSVPSNDTAITIPRSLAAGTYYLRVGCNFDDRSSFVFATPTIFIVK
jgi:hypothetical protein